MAVDVTIWAAFFAGLLSFVSPCVLPLVPPYLGFLAGATLDQVTIGDAEAQAARRRIVVVAIGFVLGFSTVFVMLGATASLFGQLLARYSGILGIIAGIAIIIMGLHFLGVFRLALLYRERRFAPQGLRTGPVSAYVMGLAFAFGWTPCIGPILASILFVAGSRETVGAGAGLLAIYSLGLGVPFVIAGLFAGPFLGFMKRFRRHMGMVERVMGGVLVLTGVLFLTGTMQAVSYWLLETFPAFSQIG